MTPYKFLVGVVLTFAMVAVLGLGALAFSARDFQYGIAQLSANSGNGLISFSRLDQVEAQIAKMRDDTREPRGRLEQVEAALQALNARAEAARNQVNQTSALIVRDVATIEGRAQVQNTVTDTTAQALTQRVATLTARPGLSPTDQQALVGINAQVAELARQEEAGEGVEAERATLLAEQRSLGTMVAESNNLITALQLDVVPDPNHYERVRDEVNALRSMSPWSVSASLAQGHPALLSTLLVLLMGALGALLYLFPAYLNRAVPVTMAEIVVRLIFGMCSALALYVLANAAVAGFSMGAGPEVATTSALLNPFTVSLVGIVAGVLSEDIASWIQERGRGIFQQGGVAASAPPPRRDEEEGGLVNPHAIS